MGGLNPELLVGSVVNLFEISEEGELFNGQGQITRNIGGGIYAIDSTSSKPFGGSFATLSLDKFVIDGSMVKSPVLDDYAAIAMSIAALKQIVDLKLPLNVYVVFHRAEEIGFAGAYGVASASVLPKSTLIYSIETSSYKVRGLPIAKVGGGIILRTGDKMTERYNEDAIKLAQVAASMTEQEVQEVRMDGGSCEASLYYAMGYRTGGLCLPLVAWHNNGAIEGINKNVPEQVHIDDFRGGTKLMVRIAEALSNDPKKYQIGKIHEITDTHRNLVKTVEGIFEDYKNKGLF